MSEKYKTCSVCKKRKSISKFSRQIDGKMGVKPDCKECRAKRQKNWRKDNPNYHKEYYKLWCKLHPEKIKEYAKKYNKLNREILSRKKKERRATKEGKEIRKIWDSNNYINNPNHKLRISLRNRCNKAIKNNYKQGSFVKDLGCSIEELRKYLESKFKPGMTWNNWSFYGWHIDHIKPLSSFNLENRKEFLEACHYTNLQPLWWKDNLIKSKKINLAETK